MSHSSKHTSAASSTTSGVTLAANNQEPVLVAKMSEKVRTVSDSESEINYDLFSTSVTSDGGGAGLSSVMNTSQISNTSTDSTHIKSANLTRSQNIGGVS